MDLTPTPTAARRAGRHAYPLLVLLAAAEIQREIWIDGTAPQATLIAVAILAVISAISMLVARRQPVAGSLVVFAIPLVISCFAPMWEIAPTIGIAIALGGYTAGRYMDRATLRRLLPALVLITTATIAADLLLHTDWDGVQISGLASRFGLTLAPIWLGVVVRDRAALNAALRERAARIERDRDAAHEQTVLEERERIAGELHDVIAHALSAIIVQVSAARRLLTSDPARAEAVFAEVERTGRAALTEIRAMLGVLREAGEQQELAPQPSLTHLTALLGAAPIETELLVHGDRRSLPAGIDLTAYRVIQEALERAAGDAGARTATVELTYARGLVTVEVTDDGKTQRRPLLSAARVELYGGEFADTGAARSVRARLPLETT